MPHEHEVIRDKLLDQGYSEEDAKRIAAAIHNERHPEDLVTRNYDNKKGGESQGNQNKK